MSSRWPTCAECGQPVDPGTVVAVEAEDGEGRRYYHFGCAPGTHRERPGIDDEPEALPS